METRIGITEANRKEVCRQLNHLLADEFILHTKTRKAHWNVEGPDFASAHSFFGGQYGELEEILDSVAERIRQLGHYTPATLGEFLALARLTEKTSEKNNSQGFIKELLGDHESIIIFLRECVSAFADKHKDAGTSDFITSLMETHEKMAWMLRAHLH